MSTIEDFKNAPIGATATAPNGDIALNTGKYAFDWAIYDSSGRFYGILRSEEMEGFTLNPVAPTTTQEALDLAWDLAHRIKGDQMIPMGTRYVSRSLGGGLATYTASLDWAPSPRNAENLRTIDPLPEPEPDWRDAPAVMARLGNWISCADPQVFTRRDQAGTQWAREAGVYHWTELEEVTPLWPKEDA